MLKQIWLIVHDCLTYLWLVRICKMPSLYLDYVTICQDEENA